jgi:hypothetical protein
MGGRFGEAFADLSDRELNAPPGDLTCGTLDSAPVITAPARKASAFYATISNRMATRTHLSEQEHDGINEITLIVNPFNSNIDLPTLVLADLSTRRLFEVRELRRSSFLVSDRSSHPSINTSTNNLTNTLKCLI